MDSKPDEYRVRIAQIEYSDRESDLPTSFTAALRETVELLSRGKLLDHARMLTHVGNDFPGKCGGMDLFFQVDQGHGDAFVEALQQSARISVKKIFPQKAPLPVQTHRDTGCREPYWRPGMPGFPYLGDFAGGMYRYK